MRTGGGEEEGGGEKKEKGPGGGKWEKGKTGRDPSCFFYYIA